MKKQLLINRNETIQGPSLKVVRALRNFAANHINFYFDGYNGSALVPKLSKMFGIPEARIVTGYGMEDILRTIFDSLDPATDTVLTHSLYFPYYEIYLKSRGVRLETFRLIEGEESFSFDIGDCLEKIRTVKPRVLLITSPNNPTGNSMSCEDFEKIAKAAGPKTLVALDEAYIDFDEHYEQKKFLALLKKYDNLILLRTFSKLYALAGLRIGYGLCGANVKSMLRDSGHYLGGSRVLEEVAIAALESKPYYRALAKEIVAERERFIREVNKLSHFKAFASNTNFVAVKITSQGRAFLEKELKTAPVVIFRFAAPGLMRVSLAPRKYMDGLRRTLRDMDRKC